MLRVLAFSLHRPLVLVTLTATFAVAGAFAFWHLPIDEMNGLPGLTRMHSFSILGLSFVVLTFDDGTDLYFARQQVTERLTQVDVPEAASWT